MNKKISNRRIFIAVAVLAGVVALLSWSLISKAKAANGGENSTSTSQTSSTVDFTPNVFKGKLKVHKTIGTGATMPTFVERGNEKLSIGNSFGGQGVYSVIAADLDNDGKLELVYASSWGSGLHRTNIGAVELGTKLKDYSASDMLIFEDSEIKLLYKNKKVTVMVRDKPYANVVFEGKNGEKILCLVKLTK